MAAVNSDRSAEQAGGLDDWQLSLTCGNQMRSIIKTEIEATMRTKEMEVLLIQIFHTLFVKALGDLFRKIAKEEIESAIKKFFAGGNWTNTNAVAVSNARSLRLRFLDEVSDDVQTGKEIKGKEGALIRVAIVDEVTGEIIESGPESSAKVELFLEASENEDEHNSSHQDFNSRIIKETDKKPHFARSNHVHLEKGIGTFSNVKLANDSNWTKSCKCKLGARAVNLSGIKVQEAWTESFLVLDSRSKLYEKHPQPSLSDEVWRLDHIGRTGAPCKRLYEKGIFTVKDFLFMLSVDPQRLKEILSTGDNAWKTIENHARRCNIDDERIFMYNEPSECAMKVVFNVVGKLKCLIRDSQHVPANRLTKDEKDLTRKLLLSAFKNQEDITIFPDERTFKHRFHQASFAPTSALVLGNLSGHNVAIPDNANYCDPTIPITPSQSFTPSIERPNADGTLMHRVPNRTNYATMNTLIQEGFRGCQPTIARSINQCEANEPGTLSQGICPSPGPLGNLNDFIGNSYELSLVVDVGGLKTAIHDSQSDFIDRLLDSERRNRDKLLGGVSINNNELARMLQVPQRGSCAATNASMSDSFPGHNPTLLENVNHYDLTQPGTSSRSICASTGPSGMTNETPMHQVSFPRRFAAMNALAPEGSHSYNVAIPGNSNHSDQAEPGTSSLNINASTGRSGITNETHMHQVSFPRHFAAMNALAPEGSHGYNLAIPGNSNHSDQAEPGTSLRNISASTGPFGIANNTLVHPVPYGTTFTGTNTSIQEGPIGCDPTIPMNINQCESTEPDSSSQGISPSIGTLGETGTHISKRRRTS